MVDIKKIIYLILVAVAGNLWKEPDVSCNANSHSLQPEGCFMSMMVVNFNVGPANAEAD